MAISRIQNVMGIDCARADHNSPQPPIHQAIAKAIVEPQGVTDWDTVFRLGHSPIRAVHSMFLGG